MRVCMGDIKDRETKSFSQAVDQQRLPKVATGDSERVSLLLGRSPWLRTDHKPSSNLTHPVQTGGFLNRL